MGRAAAALAAVMISGWAMPAGAASYDDLNYGIAARNRGNWDAAIAFLDKALEAGDLNPDLQYVAHIDRGQAHANKGELDAALADLAVCIDLRPDDPDALIARASLYLALAKPGEARRDAEAILAANPDDDDAYLIRAKAYEGQGKVDDAFKDIQTVLAHDPKNQAIALDAGIIAFLAGRSEDAVTLLRPISANALYPWLWLAMATVKQAKPVPADVPARADAAAWPGPVVDFYLGKLDENGLSAAAANGDPRRLPGQACEANFYLAEWHKLHSDKAGAMPLFQKAAGNCPPGFIERLAAQAEMNHDP